MGDSNGLKPCPFCGKSVEEIYHAGSELFPESRKIRCNECSITVSSDEAYSTLEIELWNTRHYEQELSSLKKENEELREQLGLAEKFIEKFEHHHPNEYRDYLDATVKYLKQREEKRDE